MASRLLLRPAATLRPSIVVSASLRRTFAGTAYNGIKESSGEDKDFEKHKQDQLVKQKEGKGHWKPELASDSEEAVKADRGQHEDIEKLQERTKHHAEETAQAGTSGKDPM